MTINIVDKAGLSYILTHSNEAMSFVIIYDMIVVKNNFLSLIYIYIYSQHSCQEHNIWMIHYQILNYNALSYPFVTIGYSLLIPLSFVTIRYSLLIPLQLMQLQCIKVFLLCCIINHCRNVSGSFEYASNIKIELMKNRYNELTTLYSLGMEKSMYNCYNSTVSIIFWNITRIWVSLL